MKQARSGQLKTPGCEGMCTGCEPCAVYCVSYSIEGAKLLWLALQANSDTATMHGILPRVWHFSDIHY